MRGVKMMKYIGPGLLFLLLSAGLFAGVHRLNTATDNSTDADLCTVPAQVTMVTITTTPFQGGNNVTSATVSVGGTVVAADVAEIQLYYGAILEGSVTNPGSLTNISIPSANNTKGGSDWQFILFLNASSAGKTFNLTVTSLVGSNDAVLPFTTATHTAIGCNNAPTISNTQADDGVTSGLNITSCAGRNVTISADIADGDSDPLDWTIYSDNGGGFSVCNSGTGVTPPTSISCTISSIAADTDYYISVTDGTDTALDPAGAPGSFYTITVPPAATTAGVVTAVPSGCTAINVTAPYTGDCDGDNSLSYRYQVSGSGSWVGPTPISHGASPYAFQISGLTHGENYDVEVTYVDGDGVNGQPTTQTVSSVQVGANCTGAGTVTASQTTGATPSIAVSAPYTFDNNGNNTLSYRYQVSLSGSWVGPTPIGHSGSPYSFTISSLTCGESYDVEVTYIDADGIGSGTTIQTVSSIPVTNCTGAGTASAVVDSCTQITVLAPFTNDGDNDGDTDFEWGPTAGGPWNSACANVGGATPRECVDTVTESTTYHYRVTYQDPDGVGGTAVQVIGPFDTPACPVDGTTAGVVTAVPSGCNAIDVSAPYTGDDNNNNTLSYRYQVSGSGSWVGPTAVPHSGSPYSFPISGLTHGENYDVEVTYVDGDGVSGTNPQTVSSVQVGANCTGAGTVTAVPTTGATPSIAVSAPYTFDNNGSNTLSYRYQVSGSGSWVGPTPIGHSGSPYSFTISSLTCGESYDVEVTYLDGDGIGSGTAVQTVLSITLTNCTGAGTPTASVDACDQITVSAPFTQDANFDGDTDFDQGPAAIGPWTPVCAAVAGATPRECVDTTVSESTDYYYQVTYNDADGISGTAVQVIGPFTTPACPVATTTVGDGVNPGANSRCPGDGSAELDAFTLVTDLGTDTVTAVTVDFANGMEAGVGLVEITSDDGVTVYGSQANPSDPQSVSLGININVTTSSVQYKVRITPRIHTAMPAVPGGTYAVEGTVSAITSTLTKSYEDSASATVTIDNQSPNNPTWGTITPGNTQIVLNWTNPGGDFNEVVILRRQGAAVADTPVEGTDYTGQEGNPLGSSTIVYVNTGVTHTDTPLTNGQDYYYKIFAKDTCGNYSDGSGTGPHVPGDPLVTPGLPTTNIDSCTQITVSAPYTDDVDGDSTTLFEIKQATNCVPGIWTPICNNVVGASPRSCIFPGLTGDTDYCFRVTFTDPDGVNGTNPQIIGPIHTIACAAGDTTIISNTASVSSCKQILAETEFTGDANGDGSTLVEYNTINDFTGSQSTACGTLTGASPRQCLIPELTADQDYWIRFITSDPDGVNGTNPEVLGPIHTPVCGADQDASTVLFVAPTDDATIGGVDRVKVQVWDAGDAAPTVEWEVDGGGFSAAAKNNNYNCGADCGIYGFDLDTTGYINGPHTLTVRVTDATSNVATVTLSLTFSNQGTEASGAGNLLRRTHGSQLCIDCHNISSHSSQNTSTKYGNWALDCLRCHAPHNTTNIYLIDESVNTPNSGDHAVILRDDGATNPDGGYLGNRVTEPLVYTDGICETCHTRTNYHRNDTSGANNHTHNAAVRCIDCHSHGDGFAGSGCDGCHDLPPNPAEGDSHAAHILAATVIGSYTDATPETTAAEYGFTCVKCHNASHLNDPTNPRSMEVAGEATAPDTTGMSYTVDSPGSFNDDPGTGYDFDWSKNACTNVYCHGNFTGGLNPALTWGTSSTACGDCHKGTNADPPVTGSHSPHVISTAYNMDCVTCHRGTASGGSLVDLTVHVNGSLNWDLNDEGDARIAAGSTYDGSNSGTTATFGAPFGTCATLYCHTNGSPITGTSNSLTPTWGDGAFPNDCTGCHGNDSASASLIGNAAASRDGSLYHEIHVGTYGYNCNDCHDTTMGADNRTISSFSLHVNNAKNVNFAAAIPAGAIDQSSGSWDSGTHQCSTLYCHSNGQTTGPFGAPLSTPDWDGAALGCNGCHDQAGAASTNLTAAHFKHTETDFYNIGCERCHDNTVTNSTTISSVAQHVDGNADGDVVFDNSGPNNSGGAYNIGGETCSNTYCHSDGKDTVAPYVSGPSLVWTGSTTCASCHDNADAAATNLSAAHFTHTETDGYALGCERCHDTTVTDSTTISSAAQHVDGNADGDVVFDNSGPNNSGGSYNAGGETCSNSYCHSDGKDTTPPYTSGPSIAWTGSATCVSCHDQAGAAATNLSSAHFMHTETDGYAYGCERCHTNTVSNSTTISSKAQHVDGNADGDVAFDAIGPDNSGGSYAPAGDTCSNTYCHSAGTDVTPGYTSGPSIAWTTSRNCTSCHGGPPAYGNGSPKANSHPQHSSYGCVTCHSNVVSDNTTVSSKANHVNQEYNLLAGGGASFTPSGVTTPVTCSSNSCHGNLTWGDTGSGCYDCHVVATGAANDDDVDDYTFGTAPTALIDGDDWTAYGHGNTTDFSGVGQSGNTNAPAFGANNNGCKYCHSNTDETINHGVGTNPFRLVNTTGGDGKIGVCLVCHKGGSTGYNPESIGNINANAKIDDYHAGTDHPEGGGSGDDGGTFCWDCHDPHGDQNWGHSDKLLAYMIQERPVEDHSGSGGWGIPTTYAATSPNFNSTVAGTNAWEWGDYVIDTTYDGFCQVCHDSADYFRSNLYTSGHNPGDRCTAACHKHDSEAGTIASTAFKASGGCKGCHGAQTGSIPRAQIVGASAGSEGDDFIRPSRHVSDGTTTEIVTDLDCIICHAEGDVASTDVSVGTTGHHADGDVDLRDVDNNSTVAVQWPSKRLAAWSASTAQRDDMDSFCMGCHDSDTSSSTSSRGGAWDIAVNSSDTGLDTGGAARRLTPFNTSDTQQNANEGAALTTTRLNSGVKDVRGGFNYQDLTGRAWASHHNLNQFKLRYETAAGNKNTNSTTDWPTATWTGYTTREGVTLNAGTTSSGFAVGLHCSDCHLNETNAHGSSNTFYMLSDSSGNDTAFATVGTDTSTDICSKCHSASVYGTGNTDTGNSRTTSHNEDGARCDNIDQGNIATLGDDGTGSTQITCLGCHGGFNFGMIHGTNDSYQTYKTGTSTKMYRFMGTGGSMRWYTPNEDKGNLYSGETDWEAASAGGCYTVNSTDTSWGACTNHPSGKSGVSDTRARPLDY